MKLRIESDGTPSGTSVVDAETGEPVEGVVSIQFTIDGHSPATCVVELANTQIALITPELAQFYLGELGR